MAIDFGLLNQLLAKKRKANDEVGAFDASAYISSMSKSFNTVDLYLIEDPLEMLTVNNEICDGLILESIEMHTNVYDMLESV